MLKSSMRKRYVWMQSLGMPERLSPQILAELLLLTVTRRIKENAFILLLIKSGHPVGIENC